MTEQKPENVENYPGNKTVDTNAGDDAKSGLGVDQHDDNAGEPEQQEDSKAKDSRKSK